MVEIVPLADFFHERKDARFFIVRHVSQFQKLDGISALKNVKIALSTSQQQVKKTLNAVDVLASPNEHGFLLNVVIEVLL